MQLARAIRALPVACRQLPLVVLLSSLQHRLAPGDETLFAAALTKPAIAASCATS